MSTTAEEIANNEIQNWLCHERGKESDRLPIGHFVQGLESQLQQAITLLRLTIAETRGRDLHELEQRIRSFLVPLDELM